MPLSSLWRAGTGDHHIAQICYVTLIIFSCSGLVKLASINPLRPTTDLTKIRTTFQCAQGPESSPDTQVCRFSNLVIADGQLLLLSPGQPTDRVPPIIVNWHDQALASFHHLDTQNMPQHLQTLPVKLVDQVVLQYNLWADNFHHSMESVVLFYMKACANFGHCGKVSTSPGPQLIRIEPDGTNGNWRPAEYDWLAAHPAVQVALGCITELPAPHIYQPEMRQQVLIAKSAIIGIGPSNRVYSGRQAKPGYFDVYTRPPQWLMQAFRARMTSCLQAPLLALQGSERLNVSIVNRGDDKGRHFTNEQETRKLIMHEFSADVDQVRIVRPDEMSFAEQIRAYATSSIVITTHSAATANLMFIPEGAAVVEYMWHREVAAAHDWITEVLSDLYLNATFVGVHTIDDRLGEWRRDRFVRQPKYQKLTVPEKVRFYENSMLPQGKLDGLERKVNMNFFLDWEVLRPAVARAIKEIRSGKHTFFFMEGDVLPA